MSFVSATRFASEFFKSWFAYVFLFVPYVTFEALRDGEFVAAVLTPAFLLVCSPMLAWESARKLVGPPDPAVEAL